MRRRMKLLSNALYKIIYKVVKKNILPASLYSIPHHHGVGKLTFLYTNLLGCADLRQALQGILYLMGWIGVVL